jgi:1,2-diacylglycerol 3-beta-glucosyltransferase
MPSGARCSLKEAVTVFTYLCFSVALICVCQSLGLSLVGIVLRTRLKKQPPSAAKTRFIVYVPAHNEGIGLLPTLTSLRAMNYPAALFTIVVIADNCTDDTLAIVSATGTDLLIRQDCQLRGKGFALAWAFAQMDFARFDAAVVIDADTVVEADLLARFNDAVVYSDERQLPAVYQARYDFSGTGSAEAWLESLSIAAKAAENSFVYRAREILGLTNLLQGNGFCVPSAVLRRVPWAAGSIVEDAEYAIDLKLAGVNCMYLDDVRVISRIPTSGADSHPQKVRWSKGMILLMRKQVPRLLSQAVRLKSLSSLEAAVMLLLTSRLMTLYFLLAGMPALLFVLPWHRPVLVTLLLCTLVCQIGYGALALCAGSGESGSLKNLWLLPRYVAHISAAHLRSLTSLRTKEWTRTTR